MAVRLSLPWLVFVVDVGRVPLERLDTLVPQAVAGGLSMVMLRDKHSSEQDAMLCAQRLRPLIPQDVPFVVNGRWEVALAAEADGVHLPEQGPSAAEVRQHVPASYWLGRSVHSLAAAQNAETENLDYLLVGTMFSTSSKPGKTPEGPGLLHNIARQIRVPLVGIGGVALENVGTLWKAGASGVAVVSSLVHASNPEEYVRYLRASFPTSSLK
ncbi:MAG: thiamine phosphate synthase [Deltaproteobacteria bacterium]|nr:MAG: thiamine phosphate synthase [Deltaproteobacteria bacterium]